MDSAKSKNVNEHELLKFKKPMQIETKNRESHKSLSYKKVKAVFDSVLVPS